MSTALEDEDRVRRLLLGTLPEAESDELEGRLIADEELFALAAQVEDEVAGEYTAHLLRDEERLAFEARLALVPRLRERVASARALDRAAARVAPAPPSAWSRLARLLPAAGTWQWSFASAVAGALLVGVLMRSQVTLVRGESQALRVERDVAREEAQRLARESEAHAQREAQTFALAPGVSRAAEGPPQLLLATRVGVVSFHLDLDAAMRGPFRAVLETGSGRQVFVRDGLSAGDQAGYTYVEVDVPVDVLTSGPYAFQLSTFSGGGTTSAGRYVFELMRQP